MVLQAESLGWDTLGGSAGLRWAWLIAAVLTHVCVQLVGQLGLPRLFWLQVAYLRQLRPLCTWFLISQLSNLLLFAWQYLSSERESRII